MSFDFVHSAIENGYYEPEGVYLTAPFEGQRRLVQQWGARPEYYRRFLSGDKALFGHDGIDFEMPPNEKIIAADTGIIIAIGYSTERHGRFVRIAHPWGESLYTRFHELTVDAGQHVNRGTLLGYFDRGTGPNLNFHFGIRIAPYLVTDGWGGYSDPLPHLPPTAILLKPD
ncbi:MAG: M23 family metallopeptidase [Caldilineaceae bacterium]|nr:M23 family metallopeptidase [Caldilineaceae bacterium]